MGHLKDAWALIESATVNERHCVWLGMMLERGVPAITILLSTDFLNLRQRCYVGFCFLACDSNECRSDFAMYSICYVVSV